MRHAFRLIAASSLIALSLQPASASPRIEVRPTTFDFGWAPDNAKITAEFTVVNTGDEMVPLTAVKSTCGCTATDFEPDALSSHEEKKISITFNTRGYTKQTFNKMAKVKTDLPENAFTVYLAGTVLKSDSLLIPDSDGIAGFVKGGERKKKISISSTMAEDVTLAVIQAPAPWAKVKLSNKPIKAGEPIVVEISVDGSLEESRSTSVTLAPVGAADQNRVTIAIRTGPPPPAYRPYAPPTAPKAPASGKPAGSSAKPADKPAK